MSMIVAALMLAPSVKAADPPPELWYHQAVACVGSAMVDQPKEPTSKQFAQMMVWGMIMGDTGQKIRRPKKKVDSEDVETAKAFYTEVKKIRPEVYEAHRAYCESVMSDAG